MFKAILFFLIQFHYSFSVSYNELKTYKTNCSVVLRRVSSPFWCSNSRWFNHRLQNMLYLLLLYLIRFWHALLLFLRRISTVVLLQGINHGMWLQLWSFCYSKVYFLSRMHFHSGYYYYDYVVIDVLRPSWFTEIIFWMGLLLSKEVKQLKIIITYNDREK